MIDIARRRFFGVDAIAAQDAADRRGIARQKMPALWIGAETLGVEFQDLGRVAPGIDGDRDKNNVLAERRPQLVLHPRQLVGQQRASIDAGGEDELLNITVVYNCDCK